MTRTAKTRSAVHGTTRFTSTTAAAERLFCHVYGRAKRTSQFIAGWPCSFVAALESIGRPPKHGPELALNKPVIWPEPQHATNTETCRIDHGGDLPVIEGTLMGLQADHLPGDRDLKPVLSSRTGARPRTSTLACRHSSANSISNTPSDSSSRPSAGPGRGAAHPKRETAGPCW